MRSVPLKHDEHILYKVDFLVLEALFPVAN